MGFVFSKCSFRALVRALAVAFGVFALLSLAGPALAQKRADRAADVKYQELIRRALEEYTAGNWTEARVFFEDAHAISPNARTLRGLGMTSYEARSYVEAISFLEQALASQVRPLTPQIAQETRRVLDQARRFVSPVGISVEPDTAELHIDGKIITKQQRDSVVLDPGEHEFTGSAPGFEPGRSVLVAEGGRRLNLHMVLRSETPVREPALGQVVAQPQAAEPARAPTSVPAAGSTQQVVAGVALAVVGAGGLGAGWVFYALRQDTRRQVYSSGAIPTASVDAFRGRGYLALASVGLGASLLAVSDYFWLPNEVGVPAWAWSVGGLGAAAGLVGLGVGLLSPQCDVADTKVKCQSFTADAIFGPLLAIHALPLLAVPLVYALRNLARPAGVDVSLQWGNTLASGPALSVAGKF